MCVCKYYHSLLQRKKRRKKRQVRDVTTEVEGQTKQQKEIRGNDKNRVRKKKVIEVQNDKKKKNETILHLFSLLQHITGALKFRFALYS